MDNVVNALERTEKGKKVRKQGFVPGVIYGKCENKPIKFEKLDILRIIKTEGDNGKIWVKIGDDKKLCIIKEIQRNPVNVNDILNIDIQAVDKNEKIKQLVSIYFEGKHQIESKGLLLQTMLNEIEVSATVDKIPQSIVVDISKKEAGDVILAKDLNLDKEVELITELDATLGVISHSETKNEESEEESEEE